MNTHKGQVIDNADPLLTGRIRVRINGIFDFERTQDFPWIENRQPFSSGADSGSYFVPQVGEWVYVEEINENEFVWSGGWNSSTDKPKEATSINERIIYKSPTGHTLIFVDSPEQEKLRIIDRAGQVIEMSCAMNKGTTKRGVGNVIDGGAKSPSEAFSDPSITIKDLSGNTIKLNAGAGSEYVELLSKFGSLIKLEENLVTIKGSDTVQMQLDFDTGDIDMVTDGDVNINGAVINLNDGNNGIITGGPNSNSFPGGVDFFTGTPLPGSPTELAN